MRKLDFSFLISINIKIDNLLRMVNLRNNPEFIAVAITLRTWIPALAGMDTYKSYPNRLNGCNKTLSLSIINQE